MTLTDIILDARVWSQMAQSTPASTFFIKKLYSTKVRLVFDDCGLVLNSYRGYMTNLQQPILEKIIREGRTKQVSFNPNKILKTDLDQRYIQMAISSGAVIVSSESSMQEVNGCAVGKSPVMAMNTFVKVVLPIDAAHQFV